MKLVLNPNKELLWRLQVNHFRLWHQAFRLGDLLCKGLATSVLAEGFVLQGLE